MEQSDYLSFLESAVKTGKDVLNFCPLLKSGKDRDDAIEFYEKQWNLTRADFFCDPKKYFLCNSSVVQMVKILSDIIYKYPEKIREDKRKLAEYQGLRGELAEYPEMVGSAPLLLGEWSCFKAILDIMDKVNSFEWILKYHKKGD